MNTKFLKRGARVALALLLFNVMEHEFPRTTPGILERKDAIVSSIMRTSCSNAVLTWLPLARHWSRQTNVPVALILAIIDQESDGMPHAKRSEPEYLTKLLATPTGRAKIEKIANDTQMSHEDIVTSYGLMQPLMTLAYGYGARSKADLFDPGKNIRFSSAHLATLATKTKRPGEKAFGSLHVQRIAAAYNGCDISAKYARDVVVLYKKYSTQLDKGV